MLFYFFIIAGLICGVLDLLLYSRNIIVLILSIAFLISIPVIISLYPRDEEKRSRNAAVVITSVVFAICRLILNSISLEIDFNMSYMKDYPLWMDLVGVIFAACAVYIISIRVLADKSDKVRSLKRRIITFTTFAAIFWGMCVWAGVLNMQETKEKKEAEYQYTPAPPKSANTSATAPSKPTNTPAPSKTKLHLFLILQIVRCLILLIMILSSIIMIIRMILKMRMKPLKALKMMEIGRSRILKGDHPVSFSVFLTYQFFYIIFICFRQQLLKLLHYPFIRLFRFAFIS